MLCIRVVYTHRLNLRASSIAFPAGTVIACTYTNQAARYGPLCLLALWIQIDTGATLKSPSVSEQAMAEDRLEPLLKWLIGSPLPYSVGQQHARQVFNAIAAIRARR